MGFVSINGFEIKISGGNGEVCISREIYRLGTRTDFFRMLSIYYTGPGFFINNAILMTTVYIQIWVLAVLALAGAYLVETEVIDTNTALAPTPAANDTSTASRRLFQDDEAVAVLNGTNVVNITFRSVVRNVDTAVEITSIVQLGMLTVIAYVAELLLELGLLQTLAVVFLQAGFCLYWLL